MHGFSHLRISYRYSADLIHRENCAPLTRLCVDPTRREPSRLSRRKVYFARVAMRKQGRKTSNKRTTTNLTVSIILYKKKKREREKEGKQERVGKKSNASDRFAVFLERRSSLIIFSPRERKTRRNAGICSSVLRPTSVVKGRSSNYEVSINTSRTPSGKFYRVRI